MSVETFCDLLILGFYMLLFYGVSGVLSKGQRVFKSIAQKTTNTTDDLIIRQLFKGLWLIYWVAFALVSVSCVVELLR